MNGLANQLKWDRRFLELARFVSEWSKDPSTKVGAVIADPMNRVVSVGFNGLPRRVQDFPDRIVDREKKLRMIVHADMNALMFAQRSLVGCTMYTWPAIPCSQCAASIIQAGIVRVVSVGLLPEPRWADSNESTQVMFTEAGIRLEVLPDIHPGVPNWNTRKEP